MVAVAIASVLLAVAAPSFSTWIQNMRIRNTAGDILAGIERAKAEAVQRNIYALFQLTTDLSGSCALSTTGTAWVVSQVLPATPTQTAANACNVAIDSSSTTPRVLATRQPDVGNGVVVSSNQASLEYSAVGRRKDTNGLVTITVGSTNGTCYSSTNTSGNLTCLQITVSPGGETRMCNPRFPSTDPQGC
ncbi:MAG: hypothetical protein JO369_03855 [Paucibacter sp.]|nr:hypothetical protein [Roseateles sp.]